MMRMIVGSISVNAYTGNEKNNRTKQRSIPKYTLNVEAAIKKL